MSGLPFTTTKEYYIADHILNSYYKSLNSSELHDVDQNLTEVKAATIVNSLVPYISSKPMNLAVLLGVAFDLVRPDDDRRRFKNAVKFLLDTVNEGDETFVLSVDPGFNILPIGFDKIRTIVKCIQTLTEGSDPEISITIHEDSRVNWLQYTTLDEATKKDFSKYKLLKYTLTDMKTKKSGIFNFMFLKYPLSSAYSSDPFSKKIDIIDIHKGTKTIDTYVADAKCQYTYDSFYKTIERVATQPTVKTVYFASAASSHNRSPIYINTEAYLPREKIYEFGVTNYWYTDNRYLQGICDILTLMRRIADSTKPVFFITLDSFQPTFAHPSVSLTYDPKYAKVPYLVPFNSTTTFDLSNPFVLHPEIKESKGGKRKTRRSKKSKERKTRKQKSKDTKRN